jgi:hypothetical protein
MQLKKHTNKMSTSTFFRISNVSFSSIKERTNPPGGNSGKMLSNQGRDSLIIDLKKIKNTVNGIIAKVGQNRLDQSLEDQLKAISEHCDQSKLILLKIDGIVGRRIIKDKPPRTSPMFNKLIKTGKFTEVELKELLKK